MALGVGVFLVHKHRITRAGQSDLVRRQQRCYIRLTEPRRKYNSRQARRLRSFALREIVPLTAHARYWQQGLRWISEFEAWARSFLTEEGLANDPRQQVRATQELVKDNELVRLFLTKLMRDGVGFSVPRAARRYLSGARSRLGATSLNEDVHLCGLIQGHERRTPRTKVQANSLEPDDVHRIYERYGRSRHWWQVQTAGFISIGFATLMRMGELLRVKVQGVRLVLRSGQEVSACKVHHLPRSDEVRGAFLHVCWRKASQTSDVWIPVACPVTISLLLRLLRSLRKDDRREGWLFTSRTRKGGRRSADNPLGAQSAVSAMREALVHACGMSSEQSRLYKGHSLRVGGSNHLRHLGVADEVHRLLGGWASLVSSRGYFRLSAEEQMRMCESMALKERAPLGTVTNRPVPLEAVARVTV